jgi:holliday junction DNA helicase RuvB
MIEDERHLISPNSGQQDERHWETIRPKSLDEYIGQETIKTQLRVYLKAVCQRDEALDHVLFYGPPGLGKTTLAMILGRELNVRVDSTSGPALEHPGDIAAILTNLESKDILFIDEIHRLNRVVEEKLYPAMEDFRLDLVMGQGPAARVLPLELTQFTLIGATTRFGAISSPMRDRFGIICRLQFYSPDELAAVLHRSSDILGIELTGDGAEEIAKRSRGTPRIANRLLRRVRDFAQVEGDGKITGKIADLSLTTMEIDKKGLDPMDRRLLKLMAANYNGGPVGIDTLAAALSEDKDTIEDVYEPYLLQQGFIQRTPRGRLLTQKTYLHLNIPCPPSLQQPLLTDHDELTTS